VSGAADDDVLSASDADSWDEDEPTVAFGESPRPPGASAEHPPHESPPVMTMPLLALAGLAAIGGALSIPIKGLEFLTEWLEPSFHGVHDVHPSSFTEGLVLSMVSVAFGIVGITAAVRLYRRGIASPEGDPAVERLGPAARVFGHAYYFDDGVSRLVAGPIRRFATWVSEFFDGRIVDGGITGIGDVVRRGATGLRGVQTGLVRNYALWIVLGAVGLLLFLLLYAGR
jgi:NADH-quinone oxidoreductase subunit L